MATRGLSAFWRQDESEIGASTVVLTFDDGRQSDYLIAFPILRHFGLIADFFVNTANVGRPGFLSWDQISEMRAAGMSIQSHGHHHIPLITLPRRKLQDELLTSADLITQHTGKVPEFLSVPYGLLNQKIVDAALQAGYTAVCNSHNSLAFARRPSISRMAVRCNTSMREFRALIDANPVTYLRRLTREKLLFIPKRVLLMAAPRLIIEQAPRS
jgi:peptidoglycan/xylan/chitin deacetylase (PgdA/CDA1 family)